MFAFKADLITEVLRTLELMNEIGRLFDRQFKDDFFESRLVNGMQEPSAFDRHGFISDAIKNGSRSKSSIETHLSRVRRDLTGRRFRN
jgi:hypothetical protein